MQEGKTFYGTLVQRSSPDEEPYVTTVNWGSFSRKGNPGTMTLTYKGYRYLLPTAYERQCYFKPFVRTTRKKYSSATHSYTTFVATEGPADSYPSTTSSKTVFTDTYWGRTPEAAAQRKAYSNLQGNMVNYAMLTKDLKDGLALAQDYFDRLLKAAPYIRRKKFRKAFKAFFGTSSKKKAIANSWLEFQWGVKPTIEAVENALMRATTDPARTIRVVGKGVSEESQIPDTSATSNVWDGIIIHRSVCKVYRYFKNNYFLEQAAFNPVEPAFDAVPWSFLVNWFVPVEDYLKQFGYVSIWSDTFGCDSIVTSWKYDLEWFETGPHRNPTSVTTWERPPVRYYFQRFRRSDIYLPLSFMEMLEGGSINLSIKRLLNSAALVTQRL